MRYLGGKVRIGKAVAETVERYGEGRQAVWEPFCGGLGVAVKHKGPVFCSDYSDDLIALYRAVADGWDPPENISEEDYRAAKALPTTDPLHGFCAYGCSFGGKRWGGYARSANPVKHIAGSARRSLLRDVPRIVAAGGAFFRADFLALDPSPNDCILYLDPPYQGTTGYDTRFDHKLFVKRVLAWARFGPVLVSEYDFSIGAEVWSKVRNAELRGAAETHTEKIYLVRL